MENMWNRTASSSGKNDDSKLELLSLNSQSEVTHQSPNQYPQNDIVGSIPNQKPSIPGWPQYPRPLQNSWWKRLITLLDIATALVPLLFIVLSILALRLSGSEISTYGDKVKSATTLGPTIFPIIFAAIVGRSLKALASYHAEQGAELGKLEQMLGSLTIFRTIELQILLRTFDLLGLGLIVLWALSPLGGQASLRLLGTGVRRLVTSQEVRHLSSDSSSLLGEGADVFSELSFLLNTLYISALLMPVSAQKAGMDVWSNIKIPLIEDLEKGPISEADGWYRVSETTRYSSLVGVPMVGTPTDGIAIFQIETHYMMMNCTYDVADPVPYVPYGGFIANVTGGTRLASPLMSGQQSYPKVMPLSLFFGARSEQTSDYGPFNSTCTLTRSSVESNITCHGDSCGVTDIRRSRTDLRPPGYIPLSSGFADTFISNNWNRSYSSTLHPGFSTPTEYFLKDPSLSNLALSGGVDLVGIPAHEFSRRLALVFNTYWQISLAPTYQTGNIPFLDSDRLDDTLKTQFLKSPVTMINSKDIYVCNKIWATILLLASGILLITGIYGAIVKHRLRGPQILGYVSTMTRDNPYIKLPPGGCTLDGEDRARLLKDMTVQLQDVAPHQEVGHIALSDTGPIASKRLAMNKLYAGCADAIKTQR